MQRIHAKFMPRSWEPRLRRRLEMRWPSTEVSTISAPALGMVMSRPGLLSSQAPVEGWEQGWG